MFAFFGKFNMGGKFLISEVERLIVAFTQKSFIGHTT
jgi:hypothetical protein